MENLNQILIIGTFALVTLWVSWMTIYGIKRGSLALVLRFIWIIPLILSFYPEIVTVEVPTLVSVKPIHVLIDDSDSMKSSGNLAKANSVLEGVKRECRQTGCSLRISKLSSRSENVEAGFSPLDQVISSWSYELGSDPWIIFTDAGNEKPKSPWSETLKGIGKGEKISRGLILGFEDSSMENVWVESPDDTLFSFEGKNVVVNVDVFRNATESEVPVQIQISSGKKHLATSNVVFRQGESQINVEVPLPPLTRGNHFASIEVLPTATERILWDNRAYKNIEVMPNTIGVLHLLGAPSWDGRFIRRYLKSEPKYDLISFFILRDPVDHQLTNERELSLIPFPVERLFNQELPNFRSVVIQNFSLYQFLEPAYQKNLVKFVKDGGGLLFIGGPRALSLSDYRSSALGSILPFETPSSEPAVNSLSLLNPIPTNDRKSGPYYDPNIPFVIDPAQPDMKSRDLANVYDDWLKNKAEFQNGAELQGLHRMDKVKFREGHYTPLLNARLRDGTEIPLAVASYPGKGRALWIFSDSLWRLAMDPKISRKVYYDFMNSAMTWLLRQEFRQPLSLQNLNLEAKAASTAFTVYAYGPATRLLNDESAWTLRACGYEVPFSNLLVQKLGSSSWKITGSLNTVLQGSSICNVSLKGKHSSFGSVEGSVGGQVPEVFSDIDVPFSSEGLKSLVSLTGAKLESRPENHIGTAINWIGQVTGSMGVSAPNERKSITDFYWAFRTWWIYLLFLAVPLEVLVRRWPHLTTVKKVS